MFPQVRKEFAVVATSFVKVFLGGLVVGVVWYLTSGPASEEEIDNMWNWICLGRGRKEKSKNNDGIAAKEEEVEMAIKAKLRKDIGYEWKEIKDGDICPQGCEFKLDFATGKKYARQL